MNKFACRSVSSCLSNQSLHSNKLVLIGVRRLLLMNITVEQVVLTLLTENVLIHCHKQKLSNLFQQVIVSIKKSRLRNVCRTKNSKNNRLIRVCLTKYWLSIIVYLNVSISHPLLS